MRIKFFVIATITSMLLTGCMGEESRYGEDALNSRIETFRHDMSNRVIDVSDYGIVPGKDVTRLLNTLLNDLKGSSGVTLSFPKGRYDFYPEYAVEKYRYVANHDNGLKRMGLPIYDVDNLVIDGHESLFMFHGRIVPVVVHESENVTLKNFSIDFIRPFHSEMNIIESDSEKQFFVAKIDKTQTPYHIKNGVIKFDRLGQIDDFGANMVFDPKTRSPIFNTRDYHVRSDTLSAQELSPGIVKFKNYQNSPPPMGSVLTAYGTHPTSRLVPGMHITNSKDIYMDSITLYGAGGMGLIVERTENIHVNKMKVTSRADRTISTRADATHFIGCKGDIVVENSLFEHMLDDSINVHGAYVNLDEYLGDGQFLASISHFQQMGFEFGSKGDEVAIISRETVLPLYKTAIKSFERINEKRMLITLEDVPQDMPGGPLSLENLTWNANLTFRDNIVRENRARSLLVTTKGKTLIENNYFNSQMHGILIEGDNKFWYESGAVEDVTIQNNIFDNIGFENNNRFPLFASPMFTPEQRIGDGQYHKNIKFNNNTINSFTGSIAHALSVDGLEIIGNTINYSDEYPSDGNMPGIDIHYSKNIKIMNNKAAGFSRDLAINISNDSQDVQLDNNTGFSRK